MQNIDIPVEKFVPIQPRALQRLHKLNIKTARDLLYHLPRRYEDYSNIKKISGLYEGEMATIQGTLTKISGRRAWGRRMIIIEGELEDETGTIPLLWFNQHHLLKTLNAGQRISISGKINHGKKGLYFQHPEYEILLQSETENNSNLRNTGRLVPIYPETHGITSRWLRFLIQKALEKIPESLDDPIPAFVKKKENIPSLHDALQKIHFPKTNHDITEAQKRFYFEELLFLQLKKRQTIALRRQKHAPRIIVDRMYEKKIITSLPFTLTGDQKKCIADITADLEKDRPMNRLLNGDVGSGKTIIAALSALLSIKNGFQVLFMAPTEILACQHFETITRLFKNEGIAVALLTSSEKRLVSPFGNFSKKTELTTFTKDGTAELIIGTHALLQGGYHFKNIGLVIIDEQHRFGVEQRATLLEKKPNETIPHLLSMTATPIPRTLALTIYGDLDISTIRELPVGRKKIITKIVRPARRTAAYQFIECELQKGRQAFVICPRIELPEENTSRTIAELLREEIKSVKKEYEKLSKEIFPHRKIAMLHGKMAPKEKKLIMQNFSAKDRSVFGREDAVIDILVSTSVVEVGVDIPNAVIMMIESAEKFGLASLHQFRGRVGRGEHQSYCLLFPSSENHEWNERLKAVATSEDGFSLAEKDLKIRGPGNLVGFEQSGFHAPLQQALCDVELVEKTARYAEKIFMEDPELSKYPLLSERLLRVHYTLHAE
ncbi:MAG: ATP-dependent DNA helicase RecG [Patescibacteria group bacterium]